MTKTSITNSLQYIAKALFSTVLLLSSLHTAHAQATASAQNTLAGTYNNLAGITADPYGNLYVSDKAAATIYKYTGANGSASTVVSSLSAPQQITVDASGNLWVANGTSNVAYEYTTSQGVFNLNAPVRVGSGLSTVTGVAVDVNGNVYLVDNGNKQVVKETLSGTSFTQSTLITGLANPTQVAVDLTGNVYVADPGSNSILFLPSGSTTTTTIGTNLSAPYGVAVDTSNNVYIADTGNGRVVELPYNSTNAAPDTSGQTVLGVDIVSPTSISIDTRNSVYVANNTTVYRFTNSALYFGLLQANSAKLTTPVTINFTTSLSGPTSAIKVLTSGKTGQDYQDAGSGTCATGTIYVAGQSCTINILFAPLYPGARPGAIVFYDANNKVQLRVFLGGGGLGPVLAYETGGAALIYSDALSSTVSTKTPRGAKFDAFGNLFFADTGNGQIVEKALDGTISVPVTVSGIQDVAINGAGDLIAVTTAATFLYPYENGTWSTADAITIAAVPARTINTDVAGNIWSCNYNLTGTANTYISRFTLSGNTAAETNSHTGIMGQCFSVAVDLLGNIGAADYTAKDAWYMPASGKAAYKLGVNASYPWAVAFDASGSLYMSDYGASATDPATSVVYRVPNEYGALTGGDMVKLNTGRPSFGFSIDPNGNIVSVMRASGSSVVSYYVVPRSASSFAFTDTAVGSQASSQAISIVNVGNQVPTYTQSAGTFEYGDADDFSLTAALSTTPAISHCDFTSPIQPGLSCYLGINFVPTSGGATRTATLTVPSQAPTTSTLTLTGTSTGSAATKASGLALTVTSPTGGTIYPTQSITLAATTNSAATGSITLYVDGAAAEIAKLSSGAASFVLSSGLSSGTHALAVTYDGDATYAPMESTTSVTISLTIAKNATLVTVTSPVTQATVGESITFTGTVATGTGLATPTGTLTFYDGSTSLGSGTLTSGTATLITTSLLTGTHTITAAYSGDTTYASVATSTSATVVIGSYITTTLALNLSPNVPAGGYDYGQAVTATVTVAAASGTTTPTGTVNFTLDGVSIPVTLSNGGATYNFTPAPGAHVLIASYAGTSNFAGSTQSIFFSTVTSPTTTTLATSATAIYAGAPITLTAKVVTTTSAPNGNVTFYNGAALLGTVALSSGTASLSTSALTSGNNSVYAVYAGNNNFSTSTSAPVGIAVTINPTTSTVYSSPQLVYSGTTLTVTVTVGFTAPAGSAQVPSGNATLYVDGNVYGVTALSATGVGTFTVSGLASGLHQLTGSYIGDGDYAASATTTNYPAYIAPATGWNGDFSIVASTASLSIVTGTTTSITATVTPTSNYFGYVTLSCLGLPQNSACTFPTEQIFLDGTNTALTVPAKIYSATSSTSASLHAQESTTFLCSLLALPTLILGAVLSGRKRYRKAARTMKLLALLTLLAGAQALMGCGGRSAVTTEKGTYTVNVTASGSGNITHAYAVQITFK